MEGVDSMFYNYVCDTVAFINIVKKINNNKFKKRAISTIYLDHMATYNEVGRLVDVLKLEQYDLDNRAIRYITNSLIEEILSYITTTYNVTEIQNDETILYRIENVLYTYSLSTLVRHISTELLKSVVDNLTSMINNELSYIEELSDIKITNIYTDFDNYDGDIAVIYGCGNNIKVLYGIKL